MNTEVKLAVAVWAQGFRVFNGILPSVCKLDSVVHFQIGRVVFPAQKRRNAPTPFAVAASPFEHLSNYISTALVDI